MSTLECQSIGTFAYTRHDHFGRGVFYPLRRRLALRLSAHVPGLVDHSSSSRWRRSSAKHGSPSNSRRNTPDTISSAEARQQLICAPDDAVKPRYFPEQRGTSANGYADTALAARWPATAPDGADRRAGQQGNQPSLVPVTALCVCFRLSRVFDLTLYICTV